MPGRLAKLWLGTFVLLGLLGTLWALATPLGSGPDEGPHAVKAAAAARGQLIGKPDPKYGPAFVTFVVPKMYGLLNDLPDCYRTNPRRPARCAPALPIGSPPAVAFTYVGRYPPPYYLLVGWPTRLSDGSTAIYLMRLVSLLVSAALVALAIALVLLYAADTWLVGGLFLAMTPVFTYLSSVIEPNGLESSAAFSLWAALAALLARARQAPDEPPPRPLLHLAGLSAAVLAATRSLSLAWLAAILVVVLLIAFPIDELRRIARTTTARIWAGVIGLAAAAALVWVVTQHALDVVPLGSRRLSALRAFEITWGRTRHYMVEMFGGFNPRGTDVPAQLEAVFWSALAALFVWALWRATWRVRAALVTIAAATVLAGPVLTAVSVGHDGLIWHGRYVLPFALGLPILTSAAIRSRRANLARSLLVATGLACQVVAIYFVLRRFAVGTRGPIDIVFTRLRWEPPLGATAIVLASVGVCAALAVWLFVAAARIVREKQEAAEQVSPAAS